LQFEQRLSANSFLPQWAQMAAIAFLVPKNQSRGRQNPVHF
jgi:hypothetical protein